MSGNFNFTEWIESQSLKLYKYRVKRKSDSSVIYSGFVMADNEGNAEMLAAMNAGLSGNELPKYVIVFR